MSSTENGIWRCFGNGRGKEFYAEYHDCEWGVPVHDDRRLFEFLILEGAQAGLSWETILRKREGYREAFLEFDPTAVASMADEDLERLRSNPRIVRNRLKIAAARTNARAFLEIQREYGTFDKFVWGYVDGTQVVNEWKEFEQVPAFTSVSDALSKELRKRGMKFVGSTIMYAFMQAVGMVNDHLVRCWRHPSNPNFRN